MPGKKPAKFAFYEILGVSQSATAREIRIAYKVRALQFHPDKPGGSADKFQEIQKAYECLGDPDKRELYDAYGDPEASAFRWEPITEERIRAYENAYRYSEEESADVIQYYKEYKGDMTNMLEFIMCSTSEDSERFLKIIQDGIQDKLIKKLKHFTPKTIKAAQTAAVKLKKQEIRNRKAVAKSAKGGKKAGKSMELDIYDAIGNNQIKHRRKHLEMLARWAENTEVDDVVDWG